MVSVSPVRLWTRDLARTSRPRWRLASGTEGLHDPLTNISRHSVASAAVVDLSADVDALSLVISDNGTGNGAGARSWMPGVGLTSMRERAAEVGGACEAVPGPQGAGRPGS
jgi:signal transduction histidine kinase